MSRQEQSKNISFLRSVIARYYSRRPLVEPRLLPKREIAIQPIHGKSYIRHLSFPSMASLYRFLAENPPLHLYYSSAVYEDPSASDMESKGWLGSDLIFDIDSDHYPGCDRVVKVCRSCGSVFSSEDATKCPTCGSEDIEKIPLFDEKCIELAWNDAIKIVDVIERDFGASEFEIVFSGHRGFHIRFYDKFLQDLARDERRAIVDYLTMKNIDFEKLLAPSGRRRGERLAYFVKDGEYGFRARVLDTVMNALDYRILGDGIIEVKYDELVKIAELWRVEVDPVVTMDTSRLARFVGSINGKAGLAVCMLDPNKPLDFSFGRFSIVKGEALVVPLVDLPEVRILGRRVSLRRGERAKVDALVGFYLAVRNLVKVVDYSGVEVVVPCR